MSARSMSFVLLSAFAVGVACQSERLTESTLSQPPVLSTLEILPGNVTVEQGWPVALSVRAFDQWGGRMYSPALEFSSRDTTIARVTRVHGDPWLVGVKPGTAEIQARMSIDGVTLSAVMTAAITAATPAGDLLLTADAVHGWMPPVAHLKAGGSVEWRTVGPVSWSDVPHRFLYLMNEKYAVLDSLDLRSGSAKRTFVTAGEYRYCSAGCWDPPDFGVVYVH